MAAREDSVQNGWRASLPHDREEVFRALAAQWEEAYAMLSVTLNEAIAQRAQGRLVQARNQAAIAAELAERLSRKLDTALHALRLQARLGATLPVVQSLQPGNFRSESASDSAAWNELLLRIPLGRRYRFLIKLGALGKALRGTTAEFRDVAQEIAEGASVEPQESWHRLDALHYDLNTCMRETTIVLKSFFAVATAAGFARFCRRIAAPAIAAELAPGLRRAST